MSLAAACKLTWVLLVVGWYALRRPFQRRSRRAPVSDNRMRRAEWLRLSVSTLGLGVIPLAYVVSGEPEFAAYSPHPILFAIGLSAGVGALALFRLTHKALGQMWSVSLQLKESHRLVTTGIYSRLRHPMYSAFWLMAIAQAFLLPNYVAGLSGLVGFGTLFLLRIGPEEAMMEQAFGDEYRAYRARTKRIIPFVY